MTGDPSAWATGPLEEGQEAAEHEEQHGEEGTAAPAPAPDVLVVGTGHVLPVSAVVRDLVLDLDADAVAVELDKARLHALVEGPETRRGGGALGFLARFQDRLSEDLGGEVGEDMLAGREAAMLLGVPLYCIDDPAEVTVRRAWKRMGWRERGRLLVDLVRAMLPGGTDEDVQRILEGDASIIDEFRDRYPRLAAEVLDARDARMAQRVKELSSRYDRVAVVVGDAHAPGVAALLAEAGLDVDLRRLRDLLDLIEQGWVVTARGEAEASVLGFSTDAEDGAEPGQGGRGGTGSAGPDA